MSSTPYDYVVGFIILSQFLSLIVLNVWDNELLVAIEALEEGKSKENNEKKEKKKTKKNNDLICAQYTNACQLSAN
jgi:hypothetical protein